MWKEEINKKSKNARIWFEKVKATIPTKIRKNSVGSWYLPATKNGYRWFVGMPNVFKNEIGFNVCVEKRFQATRTNKDFRTVARFNICALSLPQMLTENPEDYLN